MRENIEKRRYCPPAIVWTKWSGGTSPFTATEAQTHTYARAGVYDMRVRVSDVDGGVTELLITIVVI